MQLLEAKYEVLKTTNRGTSLDMALSLLLASKWVAVCEEIQC